MFFKTFKIKLYILHIVNKMGIYLLIKSEVQVSISISKYSISVVLFTKFTMSFFLSLLFLRRTSHTFDHMLTCGPNSVLASPSIPTNGRHFQWLSVTEQCDLRWNENRRHLEMFFPLTPSTQSADNHIQQHSNVIGWGNQVFIAWLVAHARTHAHPQTHTCNHFPLSCALLQQIKFN